MPPRIIVCLPAGHSPGSLSQAEHMRAERLVAGHLSAIMGAAVVLRRMVSKPEYNGSIGVVVPGPVAPAPGRCFVSLEPDGVLVNVASANLTDFTWGSVVFVNDATTMRHFHSPGSVVEWFCPDGMDLPDPAGATDLLRLWTGGPMVSAATHSAFWGQQGPFAESAPIASRSDIAVVRHPAGYFSGSQRGATEAQHRAFVGAAFDLHDAGVPP